MLRDLWFAGVRLTLHYLLGKVGLRVFRVCVGVGGCISVYVYVCLGKRGYLLYGNATDLVSVNSALLLSSLTLLILLLFCPRSTYTLLTSSRTSF